jgi:hypothetical protein
VYSSVDAQVAEELRKRQEAAEIEAKLKLVEEYGSDPFENGDAFTFDKVYDVDNKVYTVWGGKVADKFYLTGPVVGRFPYTWENLVLFFVSGIAVTPNNVIRLAPASPIREKVVSTAKSLAPKPRRSNRADTR